MKPNLFILFIYFNPRWLVAGRLVVAVDVPSNFCPVISMSLARGYNLFAENLSQEKRFSLLW